MFANFMKSRRKELKISQNFIADKLKVGQPAVAMWESGRTMPRADKLPALAQVLKCNVSDLLTDQKET